MKFDGQAMKIVLSVFSFCMGACIASFLNVVIWRVPRGESIVSPPSHCPKCLSPIRWWQNIPVISWLALGGRCASCHERISPRYILIEALGGALFLAEFIHLASLYAPSYYIPVYWTWTALMIVGTFIDFDLQLLPDFVTVGGMVLGVAFGALESLLQLSCYPVLWSLGGLVFGFGLLCVIRFLGSKAFKREAMGMGDVFLAGAVGAIFGPVSVILTLIIASVVGSVVGVAMIALSKTRLGRFEAIPFGPYLCLGCLVWMFYGPELVAAYLKLLGVR